jgi:hypothetical protein
MGLSDDQRAMLRMVAQRGEQGYEDIAALMGLSVDEVRAKVAAALAELDEEGALKAGEAGDSPAAPAAESTPAPPPDPTTRAAAPAPPPAPPRPKKPRDRLTLPKGQVLWAAIAGGGIIVALIVIALIVSKNDDNGSEAASASSGTATTAESGKGGSTDPNQVTKAVLRPIGGNKGEGEGVAVFGRVKKSLALEVAASGLQPTSGNEEYTIWLSDSPQKMLPLASVKAPKGRVAAQLQVPTEVLAYLANETFTEIALTLTDKSALSAALKTAVKEEATTTEYTGQEVLRGTVTGPIVGAAARLEEREAEEKEANGK